MIMMVNRAIRHFGGIFLGAGLLIASALAEEARPTSKERAILVLDASGSMWGQVEGTPKIAIARDVIKDLLGDWNPNVELGVTAYGHRQKGDCADIETLVPVGPVDGNVVLAAIEPLNPRGKTPLTDAVRQAAETLRYAEERATVLLVSDGKETCDADPCAAAAELDAKGIDFKVHVVGFDLTEEEKAQLQCIADNTGGRFLSADNAPEFHQAMATTVQLVAEAEPEPKPQATASGPTGVKLSAALTEDGKPVKARFKIFRAEKDIEGNRKFVRGEKSRPGKPAIVELAPGRYFVTATYGKRGKATRGMEIDVKAYELVSHTMVLSAGNLKPTIILAEGGEPVDADYKVYGLSKDDNGRRKYLGGWKTSKPGPFSLLEGRYLLEVSYGGMTRMVDIEMKPGETLEKTVLLGYGGLHLKAQLSEGGKAVPASFRIVSEERDTDDRPRIDKSLTSGQGPAVETELPVGRYQISARHGGAEVSGEVEVRAAEETEASLVLDIGHLSLASVMAEGGESVVATMSVWRAGDQDAGLRKIADMQGKPGQPLRFELPADNYVIKANYGEVEVSNDIEVSAGMLTESVLVLNAGYLDVSGARNEEGPPIDVGVTIYGAAADGKRAVIAEADSQSGKNAEFILAAGRYLVIANDGEKEASIELEVKPGERTKAGLIIPDDD